MEIKPDLSLALTGLTEEKIAPCLTALAEGQDPLSLEVLVPQDSRGWQLWQDILPITPVDLTHNSSLKRLATAATGRYQAIWDATIIPSPAALFVLVDFLDNHPDIGAVGPRFFSSQGRIITSAFRSTHPLCWQDKAPLGWDGLSSQEVGWISGLAMVLNREALRDVDLPSQNFPGWDRRYCRQLRGHGWHIFFCHLARVTTPHVLPSPPNLGKRLQLCLQNTFHR